MPKTRSQMCVTTRLEQADLVKLNSLAGQKNVSQSQLIREAILAYLDNQQQGIDEPQEKLLEQRLRKMEDRLAAMMMRSNIDVGVIYNAIYFNMGANAEKAFPAFYSQAVKRLQAKRTNGQDKEAMMKLVTELYRKEEATEKRPEPVGTGKAAS